MFAAPNSFITAGVPEFPFSITASAANVDLRTAALAAGWNGSDRPVCTINGGVIISSSSTGSYALTISGAFPGGVELINNGTILGKGGDGGLGGAASAGCACFAFSRGGTTAGSNAGPGLLVQVAVKLDNASGRIAGGGGGGGGGNTGSFVSSGGGGGGGTGTGAGGGIAFSSFCNGNTVGSAGTSTAGGAGGNGGSGGGGGCKSSENGGAGGAGGSYGSIGTSGNGGAGGPGGGGGAAGNAIVGNSFINYISTGTINGGVVA
jgi:hypothetical protein